jgi:hypothetical protein
MQLAAWEDGICESVESILAEDPTFVDPVTDARLHTRLDQLPNWNLFAPPDVSNVPWLLMGRDVSGMVDQPDHANGSVSSAHFRFQYEDKKFVRGEAVSDMDVTRRC